MNCTATRLMDETIAFEQKCWDYYRGLKAKGWSAPEEGDTTSRHALFWRADNGQYGIHQVEAAWMGWCMAKGLL